MQDQHAEFKKWFTRQAITEDICKRASAKCIATKKSCGKNFCSVVYDGESRGSFLNPVVMFNFLLNLFGENGVPSDTRTACESWVPRPIPKLPNFKACKKASEFDQYLEAEGQSVCDWDYWNSFADGHKCTGEPRKRKPKGENDNNKKSKKKPKKIKLEGKKYYFVKNNAKSFKELDNETATSKITGMINKKEKSTYVAVGQSFMAVGVPRPNSLSEPTYNPCLQKMGIHDELVPPVVILVSKNITLTD